MFRFLSLFTCLCILLSGAANAQYPIPTPEKQEDSNVSIFEQLPPEIQADIIEEAEVVRVQCERRTGMSIYNDCECMAAEFLEERARDPLQLQNILMKKVAKACPNIPGVAGDAYQSCRSTTSNMEYHAAEKYCTCVGNKTAEFFEQTPTDRLSSMKNLNVRARVQCTQSLNLGK